MYDRSLPYERLRMNGDRAAIVPTLRPDAEIVRAPGGELVFRSRGRFAVVEGVTTPDLEAVLQLANGQNSRESIITQLHSRVTPAVVESVVDTIAALNAPSDDIPFRPLALVPSTEAIGEPVLVVGNGQLASLITEGLSRSSFGNVRQLHVDAFATTQSAEFEAMAASRIVRRPTNAGARR